MYDPFVFGTFTTISSIIDGIVLLFVLFGLPRLGAKQARTPHVIDVGQLAIALVAVGILFVVRLVPMAIVGLHAFGIMRLVYVGLVVTIPSVALIVLFVSRRCSSERYKITPGVTVLASLGLLAAPVGLYATWIEPYRLQLETATVTAKDSAVVEKPLRLAVLADLQTDRITDHERNAVRRIMAEQPDIVLIPGDLFQGTADEYSEQFALLKAMVDQFDAPGGAFFVEGDCERVNRLGPLFAGSPVRQLRNEIAETSVGASRVLIAGVELEFDSSAARQTISRLIETPRRGRIKLLLAHRPDVVRLLPQDADIDLVVAGHTHGGQVVIPFFGPPITFSSLPRHIGAGGLHDWNGNALYVSRGIGLERGQAPRIRFLCPPEITLLTIHE